MSLQYCVMKGTLPLASKEEQKEFESAMRECGADILNDTAFSADTTVLMGNGEFRQDLLFALNVESSSMAFIMNKSQLDISWLEDVLGNEGDIYDQEILELATWTGGRKLYGYKTDQELFRDGLSKDSED